MNDNIEAQGNHSTAAPSALSNAAAPQPSPTSEADALDSENLDKIRDILFGAQAQSYDKRFIRMEERIEKEYADLREEMRKRYDALELYLKRELGALAERLTSEQKERVNMGAKWSRDLQEASDAATTKAEQLAEQLSASHRELSQDLLEQSKRLSDDMQGQYANLLGSVERRVEEIRFDKADRATLAALFADVATRLHH